MISPSSFNLLSAIQNPFFEKAPMAGPIPLSTILPIVLAIVGFGLGIWFAHTIRMREYGWKVGLILAAWLVSLSVVLLGDYKLGVDLQGGVILVYQVDQKETSALDPLGRADQWSMSGLLEVLKRRLNPDGLKEILIRPFGRDQVEIVVPEADETEVELIKQRITTGGSLRFLIVANDPVRDSRVIELATDQATEKGKELDRNVMDGEQVVGYWARVGRENTEQPDSPYRVDVMFDTLRDSRTGKILELSQQERGRSLVQFTDLLGQRGIRQIDVLMVVDPDNDVRGSDLASSGKGHDEQLTPDIEFTMRGEGVSKMSSLTSENLQRRLGIVFDNELLSAPVIQSRIAERGRITGRFSEKEVDFMVELLRSGSMPVVLYPNPISENRIGSILGRDTIEKGTYAIGISLVLVLGFTWFYYRLAGFVACLALVLNLLLTVAIMVMLRAPFTLPGLAGLVLTVGMSLDANVLIFERIREEKEKGAALRSAIRNGFDRAMVTVMDSNLTTLLTAVVLYAIGTDQVRGFGITLILGILTSMFTAIVMARVIFEIGERQRWIHDLKMFKMFGTLNVNWIKLFAPATIASVVLIVLGLVATVARGKGLFDIDLAGGTSVTFVLDEPLEEPALRRKLADAFGKETDEETKSRVDFSVNEVTMEGQEAETVWKVDSSLQDVKKLQEILTKTFTENGQIGLKTYELQVAGLRSASEPFITGADAAEAPVTPNTGVAPQSSKKVQASTEDAAPASTKSLKARIENSEPPSEAPGPGKSKPTEERAVEDSDTSAPSGTPSTDAPPPSADEKGDEDAENSDSNADKGAATSGSLDSYLVSFLVQDEQKEDSKAAAESLNEDQKTDSTTVPGVEKTAPPSSADATAEKAAEAQTPATEASASDAAAAQNPANDGAAISADPVAGNTTTLITPSPPVPEVWTVANIDFNQTRVTGQAVQDRVGQIARKVVGLDPTVVVDNPDWNRRDNASYSKWTVSVQLPEDQAQEVFDALRAELKSSPIWQTSSKIGGQVSSDTRYKAVVAILFSLMGILAYVWFRFQRFSWGIAAIAALVHDSLIMLGGIAASYWLVGPLGFLGVEEFKISLPVIAAFLTLIGYSINDTIVIFDRIREVRGKSPTITPEMINLSVNQTMSRTILTGGLTLAVIVILYFFGGPGIHAFAFSLVIGCIAGVYSTVFIASPLLLYLLGGKKAITTKPIANRQMARST
jgi:SecD/SecF fusion protein